MQRAAVYALQEDGTFALEDEAGSVPIDLTGARAAAGLVTGMHRSLGHNTSAAVSCVSWDRHCAVELVCTTV